VTDRRTTDRLTVSETAEVLGISAEAVRGRVRRGTLPVERESGTVYVLIDRPPTDRTTGDQSRTAGDRPHDRPDESTALISSKDETIAVLREQLEAERQAHAEARRIIAGLVERIPALDPPREHSADPPPEPSRARESASEGGGSADAPPKAETPAERLPWWRRFFG
jgi:hypothetical protein